MSDVVILATENIADVEVPMLRKKVCVEFSREGLSVLIGDDLAEKFFLAFGGCRIRFPCVADSLIFKRISGVVGCNAAEKLAAEFGGETIYVKKDTAIGRGSRNQEIRALFDEMTMKNRQSARTAVFILCREYNLSDRTIERIINGQIGGEK